MDERLMIIDNFFNNLSEQEFEQVLLRNGSIITAIPSCNTRGRRSEIITYYHPIIARTKYSRVVIRKTII